MSPFSMFNGNGSDLKILPFVNSLRSMLSKWNYFAIVNRNYVSRFLLIRSNG